MGDGERARCGRDGGGYYCWSWMGWLRDYQLASEEEENQREVVVALRKLGRELKKE